MAELGKPGCRKLVASTLAVAAISFFHTVLFLGIVQDWWLWDDPPFFGALREANPFELFYRREWFHRFGAANALVPFQFLTFWFDTTVAHRNAAFAYWHNVLSFCITSVLMHLLFVRVLPSVLHAVAASLGWMMLPSTICCVEFLSSRHYLEGLLFATGGTLLLLRSNEMDHRRSLASGAGVALICVSALHREMYYATVLWGWFLGALFWKRWKLAGVLSIPAVLYVPYRVGMFGWRVDYGGPMPGVGDFGRLLIHLPADYITGHAIGWVLLLTFAAMTGYELKRKKICRREVMLGGFLLVSVILPLIPVAGALNVVHDNPEGWYRAVFVLNAVGFVLLVRVMGKALPPNRSLAGLVAFALVMLPEAWTQRGEWDAVKARHEVEGRFYLDHADRLVYSELPAHWYLFGMDALHEIEPTRHVSPHRLHHASMEILNSYETIWRYDEESNRFVSDPGLLESLRKEVVTISDR